MSGRTKKDAKTAAARATFAHLLGLTEDDLEDDDDGEGGIIKSLSCLEAVNWPISRLHPADPQLQTKNNRKRLTFRQENSSSIHSVGK